MFEARDGQRTLRFEGALLAESTSRRPEQDRWVEFKLYKTTGGNYVLSRVGCSLIFHNQTCGLVNQYRLKLGCVADDAVPCERCDPDWDDEETYPEKIRYWAQVMQRPNAVIEALTKTDQDGAAYLTLVAQRLLSAAAELDQAIGESYAVQYVR